MNAGEFRFCVAVGLTGLLAIMLVHQMLQSN
jgi:hypothetical protein